jgi:hypothetical protein
VKPLRTAYDYKVICYPNGTIQIRHYDKYMTHVLTDKMLGYEAHPFGYDEDIIFNPFDFHECKEVDKFKSKSKSLSTDDARQRSYARTRQAIFTYARCANWEWFITLTFASDKVDRYDFDECSKKARVWLNNVRRLYAPDLQYVLVPELHKDGAIHFHGVLSRCGDIPFTDSGKTDRKGNQIYNMDKWRFGWSTATKVKDINKVSKYIGKYVTKQLCDTVSGKQRYYVSQNLPLPKVETYFFGYDWDLDSVVGMICDKYNKTVAHVSSTKATEVYTKVDYVELI